MSQRSVLSTVAFYNEDEGGGGDETVGWSEKGVRGWVGGWGRIGGAAFIFSVPHVIFIVNKTHSAFLSEQGLAGEASFHTESQAVG